MKTIKINNQKDLRAYFNNDTLFLSKNSSLIFKGKLKLGNNIEITGTNVLGFNNQISSNCNLVNINIGNENLINANSIINHAVLKNKNIIGPFCYIREKCRIGSFNRLGTFVEIKKTSMLNFNKLAHNIYLGDCEIKSKNIIGAGVITANFSNGKIYKCVIGNNSFIGCNSTIISPSKLGNNVIVAAGSKINFDLKSNTKLIQKNLNHFSK